MQKSRYYQDIYCENADGSLNPDHQRILNFSDPLIVCSYALDSKNKKILGEIADQIVIHFIDLLMEAHGGKVDPHKDLKLITPHQLNVYATELIREMKNDSSAII